MIAFSCTCGHKYNVSEKYAGKKVRCKECSEIFIVPILNRDKHQAKPLEYSNPIINEHANEAFEGGHYSQRSGPTSTTPAWIWYFFGVAGIFVVSLMLWAFVFRDTWEIDNLLKINRMISEAQSLVAEKDFNLADRKYDELNALIGNRELKNENLKQDISIALNKHETVKNIIRKEKERQAEMARLEEQRRKIAEEKRQQAKEERQRQVAEKERMANPPFAQVENCIKIFSNIQEGGYCSFLMLHPDKGSIRKRISPGTNDETVFITAQYFEIIKIWTDNLSYEKYDLRKDETLLELANHVKLMPKENSNYKALLKLYYIRPSARKVDNQSATMLLDLSIPKKEMINLLFPGLDRSTYVRCKINKRKIMSEEIKQELQASSIYLPQGKLHLEAETYFISNIGRDSSLMGRTMNDIESIQNKIKAKEYQAYAQLQQSIRQRSGGGQTASRSPKMTTCPGCGGTGRGKTVGFGGFEEIVTRGDGSCPVCMGSGRVSQNRVAEYRRAIGR